MPGSEKLRSLVDAIVQRTPLRIAVGGASLVVCPQRLGLFRGRYCLLVCRLGPPRSWQCIDVDRLEVIGRVDLGWHTLSETLFSRTCLDVVYADSAWYA